MTRPIRCRSVLLLALVASSVSTPSSRAADSATGHLTALQVTQLLAQGASQARVGQAIAVVDREGVLLGLFNMTGASADTVQKAIARARTGAFFQSRGDAFTTRTARFIIQDNFPPGVRDTAGGPLYGVEFSSLPGSDALPNDGIGYVSGDPGGVPLFLGRLPSGGIGVAGDGADLAPRPDLAASGQKKFTGHEESDFDETVALAGASGAAAPKGLRFNAMAPAGLRANTIFVGGLRLPFATTNEAKKRAFQTLPQLTAAGLGMTTIVPIASVPEPYPSVDASVYGVAGEYKNTLNIAGNFGILPSDDADANGLPLPQALKLTVEDVNTVIRQAALTSLNVRAAIRQPIGTAAVVHIAVCDRDGTVLGVFRELDGTNFSFDVAIQKARTAAFFSDDSHAFTSRAVGFMSQLYFPPGQTHGSTQGPLYKLQNNLSTTPGNLGHGPLANGITIFPGGAPLYKNGLLVGAVGISGDGVDQDDEIAFGGTEGYRPPGTVTRSDNMSRGQVQDYITGVVQDIEAQYPLGTGPRGETFDVQAQRGLSSVFTRLPYIKLGRNPDR